jgi:hypothetical protein
VRCYGPHGRGRIPLHGGTERPATRAKNPSLHTEQTDAGKRTDNETETRKGEGSQIQDGLMGHIACSPCSLVGGGGSAALLPLRMCLLTLQRHARRRAVEVGLIHEVLDGLQQLLQDLTCRHTSTRQQQRNEHEMEEGANGGGAGAEATLFPPPPVVCLIVQLTLLETCLEHVCCVCVCVSCRGAVLCACVGRGEQQRRGEARTAQSPKEKGREKANARVSPFKLHTTTMRMRVR